MADAALDPAAHPPRRWKAWQSARAVLRRSVQRLVAWWVILHAGPRCAAPTVVLFPSRGREMSSLLRIHVVACALRPLGWRSVVVPWRLDLDRRRQILAAVDPDLVVMQGARHPLNRPELYPGQRIVYDMDDADFHLAHLAAPVMSAMPHVERVIAGSRYVADWCRAHGARADVVWTGTPVSPSRFRPHERRGRIVAWAQTTPATYHLERAFVLAVMQAVRKRCPDVRLRLYGRRPGEPDSILAPFHAGGIAVEWLPTMDYSRFLASLEDVSVGLSPVSPQNPFSRGKSFGKILAYLDRGVPVIAGDRVDHPLFFAPGTGVLTNDPEEAAEAVCQLLERPSARQAMADRAHDAFLKVFASQRVAERVDAVLRDVLASAPRPVRTAPPIAAQTDAAASATGSAETDRRDVPASARAAA